MKPRRPVKGKSNKRRYSGLPCDGTDLPPATKFSRVQATAVHLTTEICDESNPFDKLPEEILLHTLVHVKFDADTPLTISLVCRRFRRVLNYQNSRLFYKGVAVVQFRAVDTAFNGGLYTLKDVIQLARLDATVTRILNEIVLNMTTEELAAEVTGWKVDTYDCLLMWQRWSYALRPFAVGDSHYLDLYSHVPTDVWLWLRHLCARISRCLCRTLERSGGGPKVCISRRQDVYLSATDVLRDAAHLTTVLETFILTPYDIECVIDMMDAVCMTTTELDQSDDPRRIYTQLIRTLACLDSFWNNLLQLKPLSTHILPSDWLCQQQNLAMWMPYSFDACSLGTQRTQLNVMEMVSRVDPLAQLNVKGFMYSHECLDNHQMEEEAAAVDGHGSGLARLGWTDKGSIANREIQQQFQYLLGTRPPLDCASAASYAMFFDWETALDTELLRGGGKLRRSLPSTWNALIKVRHSISQWFEQFSVVYESEGSD